jgi:hypothetical protein
MAKFEVVLVSGVLELIEADKAFAEAGVLQFQDNNNQSPKMFFAPGTWTTCSCTMRDVVGYLR